jgi:peptidoglycan/LPS O-acetylase OafA/YrhL
VWFAQAIRGVACLMVVWAHLAQLFALAPGLAGQLALFPPLAGLLRPAYLGLTDFLESWHVSLAMLGVALFFLTSGFVIPLSLERHAPRAFFLRRFFRLYPTLWTALFLILALLAFQSRSHGLTFPFGARAIASNALLLNTYTGAPFVEAVCWTLVVEEMFYAVCAACAWGGVLARPGALLLLGLGLSVLALGLGPLYPPNALPRWPALRSGLSTSATFVTYILIGVVLHHLYRRTWRPRQGVPLILCLFALHAVCYRHGPMQARTEAMYLTSTGLALGLFAALLAARDRVPYLRLLDRLADVSYPLYLIHATTGYALMRTLYLRTGSLELALAVTLAVVLAAATLLHHLVERPANDLGRRLAERWGGRSGRPAAPAERARPRRAA